MKTLQTRNLKKGKKPFMQLRLKNIISDIKLKGAVPKGYSSTKFINKK